jgi:heat shock protein HtpX
MSLDTATWRHHRLRNAAQSLLLLLAMAGILGALGWVVAGGAGIAWALAGGVVLVVFNTGISPRVILRMYGARRLARRDAPELLDVLEVLAERAVLPATPALYYVPSTMLNSFAVGSRGNAAVAVTDGMLRALASRELVGVLAHEISHVRHNDMWVMGLADLFSRLTALLSSFGQILLLLNLPLLMFSEYSVSWTAILILIFAPTVSALMQLALSRTREYVADLGAVELTGDPEGLAMALAKMERYQGRVIEQILFPGRRLPEPSLLRTHPPTEERVRRLLALQPQGRPLRRRGALSRLPSSTHPPIRRRPRWHLNGLWY